MKIGIVGQGYVGTAIRVGFEPHCELETYDKYDVDKSTCANIELVATTCEVIFVCVPTPMDTDGTCHTDIVESVVKEIDECVSTMTNVYRAVGSAGQCVQRVRGGEPIYACH